MRAISLVALAALLVACLAQSASFNTAASDLMAAYGTAPGLINETAFEELYHRFLGGVPEHEPGVEPPACAPAETVFAQFDSDADAVLNSTEFEEALVSMMIAKAQPCELAEDVVAESCDNSAREAWGWSFLAAIIVCLLSLVGAALWLVTKTLPKLRRGLTNFMIAFAVGTLISDAILHIMPEMWELHSHGGGEEEAAHAHEEGHDKWEELKFLWPGMTLLGSILMFAILDFIITTVFGHSHDHADADHEHGDSTSGDKAKHTLPKSTGYLNLAAEIVHNFLDGIAIGVAFSTSNSLGVSTTIAVGAHELPQELSDFALLLESGFSMVTALVLNLMVSLTALIGVCVGVGAGQRSEEAQKYLLAIAAGGFLYIALCSMAPSLSKLSKGKHRPLMLCLQVVGFLLGVLVLWVIAVTEPEEDC